MVKNPPAMPGLGRSSREGNGCPLQDSGLENSMDCGCHGVAKSRTRLSDFHFHSSLSRMKRCELELWKVWYDFGVRLVGGGVCL